MRGMNPALQQYRLVDVRSRVEQASPVQIIELLMDGLVDQLAAARGHMERGHVALKGEAIGRAMGILSGLQHSLDPDQGGELAANLDGLYDYMQRRLAYANLTDNGPVLEEIQALSARLRGAWSEIAGREQPGEGAAARATDARF